MDLGNLAISASDYLTADERTRGVVLMDAATRLAPQFVCLDEHAPSNRMPYFKHADSGLEFALVLGGSCKIGLSMEDEARIREMLVDESWIDCRPMQPQRLVSVEPFLITISPVTIDQLKRISRTAAENDYEPITFPAWRYGQ
jgi:hypothetical protein